MQIELRNINEIKPYPGNPRVNEDAIPAVAKSIKVFGFRNPILLDKDSVIVAGHTRLAAAKSLGLSEVPTVVIDDLTSEQIKAFRIADNQIASLADWDFDLLNIELSALQADDLDLDLIGFSPEDLMRLIKPPGITGKIDADVIPASGGEIQSNPGEVYALGQNRLYCGEATKKSLQQLFGKQKADLLLTTPVITATASQAENQDKLAQYFRAAETVMPPGAAFYLWYEDMQAPALRGASDTAKWQIRQGLIWKKDKPEASELTYLPQHLSCLYGWLDGNPHKWLSDRKQSTVLEFPVVDAASEKTRLPTALVAYLIRNSCLPGGIVLDLFGEHGATLIAAEQCGRRAYLAEISRQKCDVIRRRWAEFIHGVGCDWPELTPQLLA